MKMTSEYSGLAEGKLYTLHNFEDASDSLATIIETVRAKQSSGNYEAAAAYIATPEVQSAISKSAITAKTINAIEEEIRNIEIKAVGQSQQIFYSTDETIIDLMSTGDILISSLSFEEE